MSPPFLHGLCPTLRDYIAAAAAMALSFGIVMWSGAPPVYPDCSGRIMHGQNVVKPQHDCRSPSSCPSARRPPRSLDSNSSRTRKSVLARDFPRARGDDRIGSKVCVLCRSRDSRGHLDRAGRVAGSATRTTHLSPMRKREMQQNRRARARRKAAERRQTPSFPWAPGWRFVTG